MTAMIRAAKTLLKFLFLLAAPLLLLALWTTLVLCGCWWKWRSAGRRKVAAEQPRGAFTPPRHASIVIPNWNGQDLLEKYLPPLVAACRPDDEIIVVDNASTDGSAEFIQEHFPRVRVLQMERNLGFGGGSNAGARAARHAVVVLLNNDMRVLPGFVEALLAGFDSPEVFAVSAQIFFSDPGKRREESGLTAGQFEKGFLRVRHVIDPAIEQIYPALYAGGGSTAFSREKFLELGGFDPLFEPFYLEDTDLSFNAWRRGWRVLYQPAARVVHEHRGTIGKHFTPAAISAFLQKNYVLMVWKNVHRAGWLAEHCVYLYGHMAMNFLGRWTPTRTTIGAFLLALRSLPQALRARREAIRHAQVDERGIFARTHPAIYRDRFLPLPALRQAAGAAPRAASGTASGTPPRLNILFVSPYSVYPPLHGGAVFMYQALRELSKRHHIHLLTFVDRPEEVASNESLRGILSGVDVFVRRYQPRPLFRLHSNAAQTFRDAQFAERLGRLILERRIDLVQYEYAQLAQFHLPLERVAQCLFEHDIYFRSVQHQLFGSAGGAVAKAQEFLEWLRALRYELSAVKKFDAVFTCHEEEQRLLESFLGRDINDRGKNGRAPRIYSGLRTAVEVSSYPFPGGPRPADSLLFVGNFNHRPNVEGLAYFCEKVLPVIRRQRPQAALTVVGANAPAELARRYGAAAGVRFAGQVPDIREPLGAHAVFVAPILTGAGVRVKILEAFASGIPVVSTPFGAEGIDARSGENIFLAATAPQFAEDCLTLLENPARAQSMAEAARRLVEAKYDWATVADRLDAIYQELVAARQVAARPQG